LDPVEWASVIKQGKAELTLEDFMVFAVDITLEVRRNTRLDDEFSVVAPRVEVQADET
jgi:hypothetical protein